MKKSKKLYFVTTNKGKIKSLQEIFISLNIDIEVEGVSLDIVEPQASSVSEVSLNKAKQAFSLLKKALIVEDGGFEIKALNDFPGVYSKYILETIGANGILKLMKGHDNRECRFVSTATYVDTNGKTYQFNRLGGVEKYH